MAPLCPILEGVALTWDLEPPVPVHPARMKPPFYLHRGEREALSLDFEERE
jgi:hypothetical protein